MKYMILFFLLIASNAFAGVKMYTMTGCSYCEQAKAYFTENKIHYQECNIAKPNCKKEFSKLKGKGTPLIFINGHRIDGFSSSAIERALR